jgi:sulfite reductase alpha subunit-like flavoprotein
MLIALAAVALLVGAAWFLLHDTNQAATSANRLTTSTGTFAASSRPQAGTKSKHVPSKRGPKVTFYFASQRGTAEEFAETLAKQGNIRDCNSLAFDLENFRFGST